MHIADQGAGSACLVVSGRERWFVVRTLPQRERRAVQHLHNQGYRVFFPLCLKQIRHARKFATVQAPLFPRYLFVILDLERDRWRSINGTLGVERVLMRAGEPEPVPIGLVERLMDAVTEDGLISFRSELQPGQSIKITAGPFAELAGELEHLDDAGRVRVLLEILGGKVSVALPSELVTPNWQIA